MNIAWLTVRNWGDLCSTTTDALVHGLVHRGHELTIINSDSTETHSALPWTHISIEQSTFPGRKGSSLGKNAATWFEYNPQQRFDIVLVDWPLATHTAVQLANQGHCVVLMDRSPPADSSLLGKLQWRVWKKAWRLVGKGVINHGFVVSKAHKQFVNLRCSVEKKQIHILPAGVDLSLFSAKDKPFDGTWKMIYHGRLDKHRGVLALPMLARKLLNHGINVELTLVGEGDAFSALESISAYEKAVTVLPRKTREEISTLLHTNHIGLLPMPNTPVWSLASPLKRSEYLASGLVIFGIDHAGHRFEQTSEDWNKLAAIEDFHDEAIRWIGEMDENTFQRASKKARTYAVENCSWEKSVLILESVLQNLKKEE